MSTIRVAATISLLSLRMAAALGLGSERTHELEPAFAELLELLRRDRHPLR
jgi:hypothetical protein